MQKSLRAAGAVTVLAVSCLCGCLNEVATTPARVEFSGETMGTTYSVVVYAETAAQRDAIDGLPQAIDAQLRDLNAKMSTWDPASELSRFNAYEGEAPFPVSRETAEVVALASEVSEASGGAFDITVGPLVNAWGFGPEEEGRTPSEDELEALRASVGCEKVEVSLDPPALLKRQPDVYCDLSAIAKGYAVDKVAELLEARGLSRYLIEIGGETRCGGAKPGEQPWRVAIERPTPGRREIARVLSLAGKALATSGDYRNFREVDGRTVSHTIDPRTGQPAQHGLAAVSVGADDCARADAWATALMVLGPEEGWDLALEQGLAVYFQLHAADGGFEERMTPAFERNVAVSSKVQ